MGRAPPLHFTPATAMNDATTTCANVLLHICFERAELGSAPTIFGFAQYVSTLALLVVVFNVSDFRYRFRLLLARFPVRPIAFTIGATIGALILLIDVWFQNAWWIPAKLNSHNNLRAFLAAVFLLMVFYLIFIAFVRPPRFGRSNARQYFQAVHDFVGRGNPDQLVVVAEELGASADKIVKHAAEFRPSTAGARKGRSLSSAECAHYLLLLLGDRRLCHAMVDKAPWTAARFFLCAAEVNRQAPLSQFARNIGGELVFNPRSALHHEDHGFSSGFMGYTKPVTKAVYGNFDLVEMLAANGGSPLDLEFDLKRTLGANELEAYSRAALTFCESYFTSHPSHHSYAFTRMLDHFRSSVSDVSRLKGMDNDFWKSDEYERLQVAVRFIRKLVALLDKHKVPYYGALKTKRRMYEGVHNQIANLVFDIIFSASYVSSPDWTCWSVQHNAVWNEIFDNERTRSWKIIRFKVRRMIYDEIRRMDTWGNFKGGRLLGMCLNVLGLDHQRTRDYRRESSGLMQVVVAWTKRNYLRLVEDHPKVAGVCLHGKVTFDPDSKQLIQTFSDETRKEPSRTHLKLLEWNANSTQPRKPALVAK